MTLQEAQSIASAAINSGALRMAEPTTTWRDVKYNLKVEANKKRYLANREKNLAAGLTAHGTPRSRSRADLTGWTTEQKNERRLKQRIEWNKAHYNYKRKQK